MKTIRSNKKGFRIHSPFVYNLVTNVLFIPAVFYVFEEIEKLEISKQEKLQLKQLFRLLNYFQPGLIYFDESLSDEEIIFIQKFNSEAIFKKIDVENFYKAEVADRVEKSFFILGDASELLKRNIANLGKWFFLKKTKKRRKNLIFETLFEKEDGVIFIELFYADLIIFDKKFPSQHYVIK